MLEILYNKAKIGNFDIVKSSFNLLKNNKYVCKVLSILYIAQKPIIFINNSKGDLLMKYFVCIQRRYKYGKNSY